MTKHTGNVCETINGAISVSVVPSQWCSPGQESWSPPVLGLSELCSVQPAKSERRFILATLPLTHSYITQPTSELQFRSAVWNFKSTTLTTENSLHILSSYLWSAKKKNKKKNLQTHTQTHAHPHTRTHKRTLSLSLSASLSAVTLRSSTSVCSLSSLILCWSSEDSSSLWTRLSSSWAYI